MEDGDQAESNSWVLSAKPAPVLGLGYKPVRHSLALLPTAKNASGLPLARCPSLTCQGGCLTISPAGQLWL